MHFLFYKLTGIIVNILGGALPGEARLRGAFRCRFEWMLELIQRSEARRGARRGARAGTSRNQTAKRSQSDRRKLIKAN